MLLNRHERNILRWYLFIFPGTCLTSLTHFHSTREIQSATAMPSISEVKWIAVHFTVELPLLFISASTPTAMYINPPAVNPCTNNISLRSWLQKVILNKRIPCPMIFSPQWKMTALDLFPIAKPTATAENRFLFQTFDILIIAKDFAIPRKTNLPLQFLLVPPMLRGSWRRELWGRWNRTSQEYQNHQPVQEQMNQAINSLEQNKNNNYNNIKILNRTQWGTKIAL